MSSTDTNYTARFEIPDLIERGRDNLLRCRVYRSGALVAPTSGAVSVYDGSGSAVVTAAAVSVSGDVAEYSLTNATTTCMDLEEGWRVSWALAMPDGVTHTFRNDGALVRRRLYPVVTDADLFRLHPDLDPGNSAALVPAGTDYQIHLDEAWIDIQLRLINQGNRPNLVMSPSSFRALHLSSTLELVFRHFATTAGDGKWAALAETFAGKASRAWDALNFLYDSDDDGEADSLRRRSGRASVWLNGRA